ncbi:MAG: hypothetical protein EXS08_09765 [Planctomycetes bacterium]|nr:hypothetical protein [Planctomycetota bacterium]
MITIRGADGQVLVPTAEKDGMLEFRGAGRKLVFEFNPRGLKSHTLEVVLMDAPRVFVSLRADPVTGRVKELIQKPISLELAPSGKVRGYPGGRQPILVPPGNDSCSTPFAIIDGATAFTTVDATTDGLPPGCTGTANIHKDVWYDYIATGTGTLTVATCNAASFDTKIAIYTGLSCPTAAPIGCNDDGAGCAGFTSTATAPVLVGNHYLIRVGGFSSTTPAGTGTLTITPPAPPPVFDECVTAPTVGCGSATAFNNSGGSTNPTDPAFSCRIGGAGQGFGTSWFRFVATGTNATVSTEGSSTGDTLLAVYSGTCGALIEIGCDDDGGTGLLSTVTVPTTIGQTYYVQAAGFGAGNVGNNVLNVTCFGVPQGDQCSDPLVGACGGSVDVDLRLMSTAPSDPAYSCSFGGPVQGVGTAWIRFVATHTSAKIDTNASVGASDTLLALYDGSCPVLLGGGGLVELCCSDDDGLGLLSEFCCNGLTPGHTYYIQVSSFDAFSLGLATVTIQCPCPAPPANDECTAAIALGLPPASVTFDTTLATDDIAAPCGVFSGPFSNVWYTVTGTGNTITATTCSAGTSHPDTKISVFCGDCLAPVCVTGNDDDFACGFNPFFSTVSWCSQAGVNYLVTVGGFGSGQVGVVQLDVTDGGVPCTATVQCLPVGACCLADGSCVVVTGSECSAQGGTYQGDGTTCDANAVADGSFEAGIFGGTWNESSTNFGTPLCDGSCGTGGGTGPRTGLIWAWFGGIPAFEEGSVDQLVTIPASASTLDFYLEIPAVSGNGTDFMEVTIDGTQVYVALESDGPYVGYLPVSVPLGAFADGGSHSLEFHSIISGTPLLTNFFVDDVAINSVLAHCPQPTGACCLTDGSCVEVTEEDCSAQGGNFNGDFSTCTGVSCPQPTGACCLTDGSCVQVTEESCDAQGGSFNGDSSTCGTTHCVRCVTLDFGTEDDFLTPIGDGQTLTTPPEFGVMVSVAGTGSNLGLTAFDSTPGGPNSGTSDPDMLIGKGNILMLQDNAQPTQTVSGFFDTPIDDPNGGDMVFDFTLPSSPRGVALIDIDPEPNQGCSVILTDGNGKTRTYAVQPGWTGSFHSAPGWKRLDLTTLSNQAGNAPGFRQATVSQMAGYDPDNVVRMVVHLTGFGAIDDLEFCQ